MNLKELKGLKELKVKRIKRNLKELNLNEPLCSHLPRVCARLSHPSVTPGLCPSRGSPAGMHFKSCNFPAGKPGGEARRGFPIILNALCMIVMHPKVVCNGWK